MHHSQMSGAGATKQQRQQGWGIHAVAHNQRQRACAVSFFRRGLDQPARVNPLGQLPPIPSSAQQRRLSWQLSKAHKHTSCLPRASPCCCPLPKVGRHMRITPGTSRPPTVLTALRPTSRNESTSIGNCGQRDGKGAAE